MYPVINGFIKKNVISPWTEAIHGGQLNKGFVHFMPIFNSSLIRVGSNRSSNSFQNPKHQSDPMAIYCIKSVIFRYPVSRQYAPNGKYSI